MAKQAQPSLLTVLVRFVPACPPESLPTNDLVLAQSTERVLSRRVAEQAELGLVLPRVQSACRSSLLLPLRTAATTRLLELRARGQRVCVFSHCSASIRQGVWGQLCCNLFRGQYQGALFSFFRDD